MVNIAQVVDAIVEKLREIPELVTEMGANPDRIYAYHDHYPKRTSLPQAIYQMPAPSVMVAWQGTAPGNFGENEWPEDIVAHWQQEPAKESGAKLNSGKLELERRITPSNAESIVTKAGSYRAEKIFIKTTGRITLDNPKSQDLKPAEMPADWIAQVWFAPDYGVVQTLNRYAHMYQLVDSQLK